MPRTFYSDYVRRCMQFYVRYPEPFFRNDADRQNWEACERALKGFSKWAKYILTEVYNGDDTLADNVHQTSMQLGIKQDKVWRLIHKLERKEDTLIINCTLPEE